METEDLEWVEEQGDQAPPSAAEPAGDLYPVEELVARVGRGESVRIAGASGGLRALLLADLARRLDRPVVALVPGANDAQRLAEELGLFVSAGEEDDSAYAERVAWYPEYDIGPYHGATPDRSSTMQRLGTLFELGGGVVKAPLLTVASIGAAVRRTVPREGFRRWVRDIRYGDAWTDEALRELFSACGYTEVTLVEDRGTFAIRGDIVDVFTPYHPQPVRLERWGDEVSELRLFDASTQRTIRAVESCPVFPVREEILDEENVRRARARIRAHANEAQIPMRDIANVLADLSAGLHFIGLDALLPAVYEELEDLTDWIPQHAVIVFVEPEKLDETHRGILEKREVEFERAREEEQVVFPPSAYYRATDGERGVSGQVELRQVDLGDGSEEALVFRARANTDIVALRKLHRGVEETVRAVVERLQEWKASYGRICFVCRTRGQVERLQHLLEGLGETPLVLDPPIDVSEPIPAPAEVIEIYRGELAEGFRSERLSLCVISGIEVFGTRVATTTTRDFGEQVSISHFRDLAIGDLIVHVDFGIGRYLGLVHLEVEGVGNDFLLIEYADADKLYLPVYRLGRVQKYIGGAEGMRLDKLGGTSWEKTKEKVKRNIREVAGDLLELYARRELRKGHAFSPPDAYYHEFEAAFPFEETPDQARAIDRVDVGPLVGGEELAHARRVHPDLGGERREHGECDEDGAGRERRRDPERAGEPSVRVEAYRKTYGSYVAAGDGPHRGRRRALHHRDSGLVGAQRRVVQLQPQRAR